MLVCFFPNQEGLFPAERFVPFDSRYSLVGLPVAFDTVVLAEMCVAQFDRLYVFLWKTFLQFDNFANMDISVRFALRKKEVSFFPL